MDKTLPQIDTIFQVYDRSLYKKTGEETFDNIMNAIGSDQNANNSTMVNVPADVIGSGQGTGTTSVSTGGIESGKQSWADSTAGFFLGIDTDGVAKMNIGDATKYIKWNGSVLTVAGGLQASSIDIPDTTTSSSFHVDTSGNAWWGTNVSTGYATAPAKILATGAASFTNGTFSGTITSSIITGGTIRTAASEARVQLDSSDFRVIDSGGNEVASIHPTAGSLNAISAVHLNAAAASDVTSGYYSEAKKGHAYVGISTGCSNYSCVASSISYSYSWLESASNGFATHFTQSSSTAYLALVVYGSAAMTGSLIVEGNAIVDTNFAVGGELGVFGTKNCLLNTEEFGMLAFPATEAPTAYFTDCGESILVSKKKLILVDPKFRACINDDDKYLIFITPMADIGSFYVERKIGQFTVISQHDGAFAWEIKALRKGYDKFRFGYLDGFETPHSLNDPNTGEKELVTKHVSVKNGKISEHYTKSGKEFLKKSKKISEIV